MYSFPTRDFSPCPAGWRMLRTECSDILLRWRRRAFPARSLATLKHDRNQVALSSALSIPEVLTTLPLRVYHQLLPRSSRLIRHVHRTSSSRELAECPTRDTATPLIIPRPPRPLLNHQSLALPQNSRLRSDTTHRASPNHRALPSQPLLVPSGTEGGVIETDGGGFGQAGGYEVFGAEGVEGGSVFGVDGGEYYYYAITVAHGMDSEVLRDV